MKTSSIAASFVIFTFCLFLQSFTFAQVWERTFSVPPEAQVQQIKTSYDNGFLIESMIAYGSSFRIGWIIKTDVNGNILWEKKLGNGTRIWATYGMDNTSDGGLILVGYTDSLHYSISRLNPFIMKLDACGNTEWCRIYCPDNENYHLGKKIVSLPDNTYTAFFYLWLNGQENQSPWLYHVDETGDILWEQVYLQSDTLVTTYGINGFALTPDNRYMLTGTCYAPDSGQTTPFWIRPVIVLADSSGESVWELPWTITSTLFTGEGYQSLFSGNSIYSAVSEYIRNPDTAFSAPCMIKTTSSGIPVSSKKIVDQFAYGKATTITKVNDSTFFIGGGYCTYAEYCTLCAFNVDTLGNTRKKKILSHTDYIAMDAILTTDNKFLLTSMDVEGGHFVIKLWKLNQDLEFDTIYTRPFTYDSLCPHPITSSTLSFQCDVVTGIQESAINTDRVKMLIYPNPGVDQVRVKMPECIQKQSETQHLKVLTVFHKWTKDLELQVFDGFGRLITTQKVRPDEKEISLNVSTWSSGVYYFRLVYGGTAVASDKFVKD